MNTDLFVGLLLGIVIAFPLGALFSARYKIIKRDDKIKIIERQDK